MWSKLIPSGRRKPTSHATRACTRTTYDLGVKVKTTLPDHKEKLEKFTLKTLLQSSWSGTVKFVMDLRLGRFSPGKCLPCKHLCFILRTHMKRLCVGVAPPSTAEAEKRWSLGLADLPRSQRETLLKKKKETAATTKTVRWTSDWGSRPMLTSDLYTAARTCAHTTLPHRQKNIATDLKPREGLRSRLKRRKVAADVWDLLLDMASLEQWENEYLASNNYTRAFCSVLKVLPMFKTVAQ